jgi:hypothetical protein
VRSPFVVKMPWNLSGTNFPELSHGNGPKASERSASAVAASSGAGSTVAFFDEGTAPEGSLTPCESVATRAISHRLPLTRGHRLPVWPHRGVASFEVGDSRLGAQTLQQWLGLNRDHDYQLLEVVRNYHKKSKFVPIKIMELFHSISGEDARKPATYQLLVEGLNNDLMPIRTLSHWHLLQLVPAGAEIVYDPAMPPERRVRASRQWTDLITAPPKKKDKG